MSSRTYIRHTRLARRAQYHRQYASLFQHLPSRWARGSALREKPGVLISVRELPEEYDLLVDPHVGDFQGDGDEDEVRVPLELRVDHEPATRHKEQVAVDEDPNKSPVP